MARDYPQAPVPTFPMLCLFTNPHSTAKDADPKGEKPSTASQPSTPAPGVPEKVRLKMLAVTLLPFTMRTWMTLTLLFQDIVCFRVAKALLPIVCV
jgi:hypothetical protein